MAEALPRGGAVGCGRFVELDRDPLQPGRERNSRLGHARPGADDDDRRECGVEVGEPVQLSDRDTNSAQSLIEQADVRLIDEAPHDRDDHRRNGPRDKCEDAHDPEESQALLHQDGQAESEDVLQECCRDGPDDADLEGLPEQVVAQQPHVVVEEGRRKIDVDPGLRVGETEVDALSQWQHAEEDHRDERR